MRPTTRYLFLAALLLVLIIGVGKFLLSSKSSRTPPEGPTLETVDATGGGQSSELPGARRSEAVIIASNSKPAKAKDITVARQAGFTPGPELQSTTGQGQSRRAYTLAEGKPTANVVDIEVNNLLWSNGMLSVVVECVGNAAQAGESAVVGSKFFIGDPDSGGKQIGTGHIALKVGETSGSAVPWHPKRGQYAVYVLVDPENLVAETDKANNKFAKLIDIPATLGPDGQEIAEGVDVWITSDDITVVENNDLGTYAICANIHVQGNDEPVHVETRIYLGDPGKGGKLIGHGGGTTPSGIRHEEIPWNPRPGEYQVFVGVAPVENELNTGNNQASKMFRFSE